MGLGRQWNLATFSLFLSGWSMLMTKIILLFLFLSRTLGGKLGDRSDMFDKGKCSPFEQRLVGYPWLEQL